MGNQSVAGALIVAFVALAGLAGQTQQSTNTKPATVATVSASSAFDKIKSLAGDWETKTPEGKVATGSFKVVSAGSAVMITSEAPGEDQMITMVHPDGSTVIATHYCSAKNQPRFELVPSDNPNVLNFRFKDITNLASPEAGHMTGAVFKIVDANHHSETWTWTEDGKEQTFTMDFVRKN